MPQILPAGQLNIAALAADDLYIQIVNPPNYITGVATDCFGVVGTASWGVVDQPIHMGSGQDAVQNFGAISAASLTDQYDLATDLYLAFGQASNASSLEGWGVRVSDGTDTAATGNLVGVASSAEAVTVGGSIKAGDVGHIQITSSSITGSPITVSYTVLSSDTLASVTTALVAAINTNAALTSAYINAAVSGDIVEIYYPSADTVTFVASVTGSSPDLTLTAAAGTGSTTGITITANCTGVLGNQIILTTTAGSGANTFTVSLQPFSGTPEVYPNIPAVGFWSALKAAINTGISTYRGPSQYVKASNAHPAVGAPTLASVTLAGGTDGRAGVTTAILLGSDTAMPRTGMYALRQLQPAVSVIWLVGCTDFTDAAALEVAFNQSEGCSSFIPFPVGTSTATATAAVSSTGVHDPSFAYLNDWIYFFDTINNVTRLVPPTPVVAGMICTLTPEQSPGNKPVSLVNGTIRNSPITGNSPYTPSEIAMLENAGIMLITNPIPAGSQFGVRHGQTTSLMAATAPFEYWRMTSYLARSFASTMGQFVDQLQSQQPNDPLRQTVKLQLNTFLQTLVGLGQIDSYLVTCAFSSSPSATPGLGMNTPASVAQHYMFALVQVTYLSSVRFFILSLQGGTTVVSVGSNLSQAPVNG